MTAACEPRWATPRTPSRQTMGETAAVIAEALGTPLMPWQRQVLDVALEVDAAGRLVYRDVVVTTPRQSGKTTCCLCLIILRALSAPGQQIRYTAQTGQDARKKWVDDWLPILKASPFSRYFDVRLANGHEALLWTNGSNQSLVSTTQKAGHGSTIDLVILDEAFAHPDARLEQALRPAMITRADPQFWIFSTAGTVDASPYLWAKIEAGRQFAEAGATEGLAYFEWSAEDSADPADPQTWRSCMPALGRTVNEAAVAGDHRAMDGSEFARAYLNRWVHAMTEPIIPAATWAALIDERSAAPDPVCFAFDISPNRGQSSIALASRRSDDLFHVEVVEGHSGTGWVVDRIVDLVERHKPTGVYADTRGPASPVAEELARRGVEVVPVTGADYLSACGGFYDAVVDTKTIRHIGQLELATAIDGAARKHRDDAWIWSRRSSSVDITPLVAATCALFGARNAEPPSVGIWSLSEILAEKQEARRAAGLPPLYPRSPFWQP